MGRLGVPGVTVVRLGRGIVWTAAEASGPGGRAAGLAAGAVDRGVGQAVGGEGGKAEGRVKGPTGQRGWDLRKGNPEGGPKIP